MGREPLGAQVGILVVCAVAQELAALPARPGGDVVAVGVGPVESALGTARALALAYRFRADVESMEGFAVLRAAQLAGVPAIEIRGVSNLVGERESNGWNFRRGALAAAATTGALLDVLLAP
jgi:futalosine hydrolase